MLEPRPTLSHRDRVLAAAAAQPSLTRRQGRTLGAALVAASVALGLTLFEAVGGIGHSAGRPLGVTLGQAAGCALVAAALTWLVLARRGSTMPRRPLTLALAALATPVLFFVWMRSFGGASPEPLQRVGYRCLSFTLAMTALPLASFLALKRAVEPRYPAALGAAAGAACAAWAGTLVDVWCPLTSATHVLVGHVAPLIVAIAAGACLGRVTLGARGIRAPRNAPG